MCGSARIELRRVALGRGQMVRAELCRNCGERYYDRAAGEEILVGRKRSLAPLKEVDGNREQRHHRK